MIMTYLWDCPRRDTDAPYLQVTTRGGRYPTAAGVVWVAPDRFIANHHAGREWGLFQVEAGAVRRLTGGLTPTRTDELTALRLDAHRWRLAASGCWRVAMYQWTVDVQTGEASAIDTIPTVGRAFAHGVGRDADRNLWVAYSSGTRRFARYEQETEVETHVLPDGWRPKGFCLTPAGAFFGLSDSTAPKRQPYETVNTSVWEWKDGAWTPWSHVPGMQVDAGSAWQSWMVINDQGGHQLRVLDLETGRQLGSLHHPDLSFPHGVAISPEGQLAVTNFGTSSLVVGPIHEFEFREAA